MRFLLYTNLFLSLIVVSKTYANSSCDEINKSLVGSMTWRSDEGAMPVKITPSAYSDTFEMSLQMDDISITLELETYSLRGNCFLLQKDLHQRGATLFLVTKRGEVLELEGNEGVIYLSDL